MSKIIKIFSVNCILALMFIAPLFSQTNNQIEIKVYDGYAYFNSSKYVPIDNAKVLYYEVESILTHSDVQNLNKIR